MISPSPETTGPFLPPEPDSLHETGLPESTLEHLILKILYFRGDVYGQDLSQAIGLRFSVIENIVETLKIQYLLQVKRSLGMGSVGALFALTDSGRARAREALDFNQYSGPAPVPLEQYTEMVRQQKPRPGWLTKEGLAHAFRGMVVTERVLSQVGPAVSSANSMLIYGKPGDGKTFLIEQLQNLEASPIFVPYAIECQGNIIQLFDPIYHRRIGEDASPRGPIALEASYDARWVKCHRPFIVSGGELSMDMLDLRYNTNSKVYEAPFQLKANNGIYLIDDFGRQRATPAEVLNRWIVPMERKIDYLSFLTGGKLTAPFEAFLVFSTNLNPADLGDEAFLRRLQYKMLLRGPGREEFIRIFESACEKHQLEFDRDVVESFIERFYHSSKKPFRRCQPRDLLSHAMNLIRFEKLPLVLTSAVLERAFESCFLTEAEDADTEVTASPILIRKPAKPCADFLKERIAQVATVFGRLAVATGMRERPAELSREYSAADLTSALGAVHGRIFHEWLDMDLDEQSRDLGQYLSTPEGRAAFLSFDRRELANLLAPPGTPPHEMSLFSNDLQTVVMALSRPAAEPEVAPQRLVQQIA